MFKGVDWSYQSTTNILLFLLLPAHLKGIRKLKLNFRYILVLSSTQNICHQFPPAISHPPTWLTRFVISDSAGAQYL